MMKWTVIVLLLLVCATSAGASSFTSEATTTSDETPRTQNQPNDSSLRATIEEEYRHRRLAFEPLFTYEPQSKVTDQAAIDLDLQVMKGRLTSATELGIQQAVKVYELGGHSKSVAKLTLDTELKQTIPQWTHVVGVTEVGSQPVRATVLVPSQVGSKTLLVHYDTTIVQSEYLNCQVGGLPQPNTEGCFASAATLSLPDLALSLDYQYNLLNDNINDRTIQKMSTGAKQLLFDCDNHCPYPTYEKFFDYYGKHDYADHIIKTAAAGQATSMTRGNSDFALYELDGRGQVMEKAAAYMILWMTVIRAMEKAIDHCIDGCASERCDNGLTNWDEAVAYYSGSRQAVDGGTLLFSLADQRCKEFRTCGEFRNDDTSPHAHVNHRLFKQFRHGQRELQEKKCEETRAIKTIIESAMVVPLIQGTLRFAHLNSSEDYTSEEKHIAEGNVFAMSVLPLVYACNKEDAEIIYANTVAKTVAQVDYVAVKNAFERNYQCMGVTCMDVGGVYDSETGGYRENAHPCTFDAFAGIDEKERDGILLAILSLSGILLLAIVACCINRQCEKNNIEYVEKQVAENSLELETTVSGKEIS